MEAVRQIFREYANSLGVDLCFQNFESELAQLPGDYAAPRGALLLAEVGGAIAGCCALRPLDSADYPNASEMKRLYVRKAFRRRGLGRELAEATLDRAPQPGYASLFLHTPHPNESRPTPTPRARARTTSGPTFPEACQPLAWASSRSAPLTSNWPGASTLSVTTLPSRTSIEQRLLPNPSPLPLRSSVRPVALVKVASPSASRRSLPALFCSRAQAPITKASLTLMHQISSTPAALNSSAFCR